MSPVRTKLGVACGASLAAVTLLIACGGGGGNAPPPVSANVAPGGSKDQSKWPKDDRSLCGDWRKHPELEVIETAGPGAFRPNVRRVFKWTGAGDNRSKVLVCREIDTNLDGIKDVVRTFDLKKGDPIHEEADRNYDGKIDDWVDFVAGRMAKEAQDTRGTGYPDVCKSYNATGDGALFKIRRNTHCKYPVVDCRVDKPSTCDTWEYYQSGTLIRIGTDDDCNGHIDRWDRDTIKVQQQQAAEQAAAAAMAAEAGTDLDGGSE
jgi:hypothetical protein